MASSDVFAAFFAGFVLTCVAVVLRRFGSW
jgi:hypothetical protein